MQDGDHQTAKRISWPAPKEGRSYKQGARSIILVKRWNETQGPKKTGDKVNGKKKESGKI